MGTVGAITQFLRLTFLRPIERFLAQVISISTAPTAFVRERIHLGDTTNFLRAAGFFVSAISTAFLAEVATLYLLGIGDLTEPYYWLFILLTSIPFVLICFLLVRFVAPLSFRDVLHLSFHPIGAGVFTGAVFALLASAVVASLIAVGYIPEIKHDLSRWGNEEHLVSVLTVAYYDCLKRESLLFTIVASGLQEAYSNLKAPLDYISYIRPFTTLLYLLIAALAFTAAVDRRKSVVFGLVFLAALVTTFVEYRSLKAYSDWTSQTTACKKEEKLAALGFGLYGDSALKEFARGMNQDDPTTMHNWLFDLSVGAEGRTLTYSYHFKRPWPSSAAFYGWLSGYQKLCSPRIARMMKTLF